jgi:hypothetical protein
VAATLPASQVVFASFASSAAFSLAQLPLAFKCLDPVLKLLPLHLQALCQLVLLHAACLHFPWLEKPSLALLSCEKKFGFILGGAFGKYTMTLSPSKNYLSFAVLS